MVGDQHIDAGYSEAHNLSCSNGGLGEVFVQLDGFGLTAPMNVAAKIVRSSRALNSCDNSIAHHKGPDILAVTFGDVPLDDDVSTRALKRFDDGFRRVCIASQNYADSLGAFSQLDHNRGSADSFDSGPNAFPVGHKGRGRYANIVPRQDLKRA